MATVFRLATDNDGVACLDIYAPFVVTTAITFEVVMPTVQEMSDRIRSSLLWIVAVDSKSNKVIGYASASPFRSRAAFVWSVETSIYIAPIEQRKNVGRTLYECLLDYLRQLGYYRAIGVITLPNVASEVLHKKCGYSVVGVTKNIGYKLGQWWSVSFWEKELLSITNDPPLPVKSDQISFQFQSYQHRVLL